MECHEKVARFHILFMHELGEELDMSDNLKPEIDEMYKCKEEVKGRWRSRELKCSILSFSPL